MRPGKDGQGGAVSPRSSHCGQWGLFQGGTRGVQEFLVAAVTTHHKLIFEQHKHVISQFGGQKPDVGLPGLKSRCRRAGFSRDSRGKTVSSPRPAAGGPLSLACGPFLCFHSQQWPVKSFSGRVSLPVSSASLSHVYGHW